MIRSKRPHEIAGTIIMLPIQANGESVMADVCHDRRITNAGGVQILAIIRKTENIAKTA